MKTKMTVIAVCLLVITATMGVINATAYQDPVVSDRYCVELKDGKMLLTQDNKPVMMEVALNDGSKVTTAGIVIRKDGSIIEMKSGDCIDKEGNINHTTNPTSPIQNNKKNNQSK